MSFDRLSPAELEEQRREILLQLTKIDEELNRRRQADRHLFRAEDLKWTPIKSMTRMAGMKKDVMAAEMISPYNGFNTYNLRSIMLEVPPKTSEGRYHMHAEAIKYYLSGRALEMVGDKEYEVKAGDAVYIPANEWHGTQNNYDQPVKIFVTGMFSGTSLQRPALYKIREDLYKYSQ
jgi:quercetin dioxygenase-like cupin family protein